VARDGESGRQIRSARWLIGALCLAAVSTGCGLAPRTSSAQPNSEILPTVVPGASSRGAPPQGPLEPGTYEAIANGGVGIALSFTVPDGWANTGSAIETPPGATFNASPQDGQMGISFWTVSNTYADPCRWMTTALDPPLGPTVQDLVMALDRQTGMNATMGPSVTVDVYAGQRMKIEVPVGVDASACDDGMHRFWIAENGAVSTPGNFIGFQQNLWILDVDGKRMVIEGDHRLDATAAERAEIESIVDSLDIRH
jgi:hypothetical protein